MKKKQGDKKYLIGALCTVFLSLVVGYAIFGESLKVSGTAQTIGTFNVEFNSATISSKFKCNPTATISTDKNTLTIAVPDMAQPGATTTIAVIVKNTGNIAAKLLSVGVTGNTNKDVNIVYPTWNTGVEIAAGATYSFNITITWNIASTTNVTLPFTATLNYQQGE